MTCPSCGAPNHADFSFCLQCGHPLSPSGQTVDVGGSETRADFAPVEAGTMAMSMPTFDGAPGKGDTQGSGRSSGAQLRVDQGSVDEQVISLDRPITIIGRRQGSDVVIHDTNVSRMHAQIKRDGSRLTIEDAGSANGTLVNDERIEGSRLLQPGDVIRIGDAVFIVELELAAPDAPGMDSPEGSTMAIDLDSPMTSLGGAPDLAPPLMMTPRQPSPLTPPPQIMESPSHTALSDSALFEEELSPPDPSSAEPAEPPRSAAPEPPVRPDAPAPFTPPAPAPAPAFVAPTPAPSVPQASPASSVASPAGSTAATLASLRQELAAVGTDLTDFSGTLGSLADRVDRLERALDDATSELAAVADAVRGPDASVLKELQGIVADIQHASTGPQLSDAMQVLEQLASQPRDIELLLRLSQQAGAVESALRIHGRLVAAAPQLGATLARLTS